MSRKVKHMDAETCQACGSKNPGDITLQDMEGGNKGELTIEDYQCENCGATGTVTYTPPDRYYHLHGSIFGEPDYNR